MSIKTSVFYTESAKKDLKKINKKDSSYIVKAVEKYTNHENPLKKSKKLVGIFEGLYRYRIGNYRAIFEYDKKGKLYIIMILKIKHRKDIYK